MSNATAAAVSFAMDLPTKFGRLGEELDQATIALQRLEDYVAHATGKTPAGPGDRLSKIRISVEGASFADGTAYLQEDLNRHLGEYIVEMLERSVADRRAAYQEAADKLKAEMGLGASVPPVRGRGNGRQGDSS